jgi:hypothetical protein
MFYVLENDIQISIYIILNFFQKMIIDCLHFKDRLISISLYSLLQKKLQDVSMKFRLFQKPANFEQRLEESKMILDEVKMHLPALETKSVEQEVIQSQLSHCVVCIASGKYPATFSVCYIRRIQ